MDLSIIILSFNTREILRDCLRSIYETTKHLQYEVIVVDNGSTDGSAEMVGKEFKKVRLIRNRENRMFSKANNQAIRVARGRYLLLLNSDTRVKEGAIETLVSFMEAHPRAGAAGPKVLNRDGTLQMKGFSFPSIRRSLLDLFRVHRVLPERGRRRFFSRYYWNENDLQKVDWVAGCCILMRREAVEEIGALSEDFDFYFEDAEWCFRARKANYEVWYIPTAAIVHLWGASPMENPHERSCLNEKLFFRKTMGLHVGLVVSVLSVLYQWVTYLRTLVNPHHPEERVLSRDLLRRALLCLKIYFYHPSA